MKESENVQNETQLTEVESLRLITRMINKAKNDYVDTGIAALMWGSIITFCGIVSFCNYWWHVKWLNNVWWLPAIALIPQLVISNNEKKRKKFKTYNDDAMGGIWLSFAITLFLLTYYINLYKVPNANSLFIIIYGIPTFATGFSRQFKPMIIGGIICWLLAIAAMHIGYPYSMLITAAAAQVAWFIPGLILRRRYRKAKAQHV
jgi:hypothetical protein